jgi:imidazolonepropionase-like amidohydrolase
VLVKGGRIAEVYAGTAPEAKSLNADAVEAAGKTVLPGLIDLRVTLTRPGSLEDDAQGATEKQVRRELLAYLYCGVTAVGSAGDPPERIEGPAGEARSGMRLGAEVFRSDLPSKDMPMLAAAEALRFLESGGASPLERSLVQQVGPQALIESVRKTLRERGTEAARARLRAGAPDRERAAEILRGTPMAGTGSGLPLLPHGPVLHRELQLWVEAGVPAGTALRAATLEAARRLGAERRMGSIEKGKEATLVVVDGDPLRDIAATERISVVIFRGERIARGALFEEE